MGAAARRRVFERFDPAVNTRAIESIMDEAIARGASPAGARR
jgi:hypothetical protein